MDNNLEVVIESFLQVLPGNVYAYSIIYDVKMD